MAGDIVKVSDDRILNWINPAPLGRPPDKVADLLNKGPSVVHAYNAGSEGAQLFADGAESASARL